MHLRLVPPPGAEPPPEPDHAPLLALDELLAAKAPWDDDTCARAVALAERVPGRQRAVTSALGDTRTSAAVDALLALPGAPGTLEALTRCFAAGVVRRFTPLALVDPPLTRAPRLGAPELDIPGVRLPPRRSPPAPDPSDAPSAPIDAPRALALDFRSSRTRTFPELVRRAQAIAATARGCAEFEALAVHATPASKHHYRLSFWTDRSSPAAVAAALRAVHLDLTWLHARLVRLRGTRLWLSGWSLADDHPIGPAAQAHLLQAWLRRAEHEPSSS